LAFFMSVATKLAVNAGVQKMSNAADTLRTSVTTPNDEEDPQKKEEEEEESEEDSDPFALSMEDCVKNPCLFIPVVVFTVAGFVGFLFFIVFAVSGDITFASGILGILLFVCGSWAAIEIWRIGSLKDQIKRLRNIRSKLENDTNRLSGEVGQLEGENAELEGNVNTLKGMNDELETRVAIFDEKNEELKCLSEVLEKQNSELKDNVNDLSAQNDELNGTMEQMGTEFEEMNVAMKGFDELRENLSMMSEESGQDMSELINKAQQTYKQMDDLVRDNEEVLLSQIAADVEYVDRGEGISEREFKRFAARLPKRYKEIFEEENITFESVDPNGDGNLDATELKQLILDLVQKNEDRETKNRTE